MSVVAESLQGVKAESRATWPVLGASVLFAALPKLIPRGASPEG